MALMGGVAMVGSSSAGNPWAEGRLRNLEVVGDAGSTAVARFGWETLVPGAHVFYGVLDGALVARVREGQVIQTDSLEEGGHELVVVPGRITDGPPNVEGDLLGSRALVKWLRSSAADVVAYRVYTDGGTGTIGTEPTAVVSAVDAVLFAGVDGGSGGRLSLRGTWTGGTINEGASLAVGAGGAWSCELGGVSIEGEIWGGMEQVLTEGLSVVWEDGAGDYEEGDAWTIVVGPRTFWISGELEAGTYQFEVTAVDGAGNESAASEVMTVVIDPVPEAPGDGALAWDAEDEEVTVTWSDPSGAAKVRVYTNFDAVTGVLGEFVIEEGWIGELEVPSEESFTFGLGSERGEVLVYIRAVDEDGVEEQNATLLRVSAADEGAAELAAPVIVEAVAGPGGALSLRWKVDISEGIPTALVFSVLDGNDWDGSGVEETLAFTDDVVSFPVASGVYTTTGTFSGEKWVGVQGSLGGLRTVRGGLLPVTADSSAPDAPEAVVAWPI